MKKLMILVLMMGMCSLVWAAPNGVELKGFVLYEQFASGGGSNGSADTTLNLSSASRDAFDYLRETFWDGTDRDQYRGRITGYIIPPVTANYTFRIASDDSGRLWLSSGTNPVTDTAARICRVDGAKGVNVFDNATQTSAAIALVAGKAYWFRAGYSEGGGGDHIQIQWMNDAAVSPITWQNIPSSALTMDPFLVEQNLQVQYEAWSFTVPNNDLPTRVDIENALTGFPATPTKTGVCSFFDDFPGDDLSSADNAFVVRERAIIKLDQPTVVGFATNSDDASHLFVGPWWEANPTYVQVVNNNGGHGMPYYRYGAIELPAGYVGITVTMCEGGGGNGLRVYYYTNEVPVTELSELQFVSLKSASRYSPRNGATNVATNAVCSWTAPMSISAPTYQVYFGKAGTTLGKVQDNAQTSYTPVAALDTDAIYNWRVDTVEPNNLPGGQPKVYKGPTLAFATAASDVVITQQPVGAKIDKGTTYTLSVVATSGLPLSYQWKKDGTDIAGAIASTFVIDDADRTDTGSYSCFVSNTLKNATSNSVVVVIKELMAYYPLDTDLLDHAEEIMPWAAGNRDASFKVNDPNLLDTNVPDTTVPFVAGKVGQGIQFNGVNQYAYAGTWDPSVGSGKLSVAFWAKWNGHVDNLWQGAIGKRTSWNGTQTRWQIELDLGHTDARGSRDLLKNFERNGQGAGQGWRLPLPETLVSVGGRVFYSAQHPTSLDEAAYRAFDGSRNTKWLAYDNKGWLTYVFPEDRSYVVTSYIVVSGNDSTDRDPDNWTLQGSNDGTTWTVLDTRTGQAAGWARREARTYPITNTTAYKQYKLDITKNNGSSNRIQLSEIELYANDPIPASDTWFFVTATFDGTNATLYANGRPLTSRGFSLGPDTTASMVFGGDECYGIGSPTDVRGAAGGEKIWGGNLFNGTLDDIRIYNYDLTQGEVLQLYRDVVSGPAECFAGTEPLYDFNKDCVVDVADLIMMLKSEWLENNMAQ